MTKKRTILITGVLLAALAGCGGDDGGGGDQQAFCNALEDLSDQVNDGDLGDEDGRADVIDTANELISDAPADQLQDVRDVAEAIADADDGDADDVAEQIRDDLGALAEDCEIDEDEFAVGPTTTEAPETTTTTEPPDDTTTLPPETDDTLGNGVAPGDSDGDGFVEVDGRQPIPADLDPQFLTLAQGCFDGDPAACDELFGTTPVDSVDEAYGDSCGGRVSDGQRFELECADLMGPAAPVPADIVDVANANACFAGDMAACDALFTGAQPNTTDQQYGGLCGLRVVDTNAFCVDVFGETTTL